MVDPHTFFSLRQIGNWATYQDLKGGTVGVSEILVQIDREIVKLQQARNLLVEGTGRTSKKSASTPTAKKTRKKKRNLTPEGRKRIAEAVKRRWAEQKKAAGK